MMYHGIWNFPLITMFELKLIFLINSYGFSQIDRLDTGKISKYLHWIITLYGRLN